MGHNVWEYRKRLEEKSVLLCYLTAAGGQRVRHMHIEPGTASLAFPLLHSLLRSVDGAACGSSQCCTTESCSAEIVAMRVTMLL